MEVRGPCIKLVMIVLMLLVAHVQPGYPHTADAAFRIVPTRLQLFDYSPVRFTCEGFNVSAGCTVRNVKESVRKCSKDTVKSTVTCTIDFTFISDSGEYWCEGGGERSNAVTITVTGGHVILESPVLPVMEGDAVTLRCTNRTSSTSLPAVFYKDGLFIGNSSTGNMSIESVSKSDEGLYKCAISGAGESAESRLAVRASDRDDHSLLHYIILKWTAITVVVFLQLLVMGLLYWKKQLVLLEAKLNDPQEDLYAVINKDRKKKKEDNDEPLAQSFCSTFTVDDASPALQNGSHVILGPCHILVVPNRTKHSVFKMLFKMLREQPERFQPSFKIYDVSVVS